MANTGRRAVRYRFCVVVDLLEDLAAPHEAAGVRLDERLVVGAGLRERVQLRLFLRELELDKRVSE